MQEQFGLLEEVYTLIVNFAVTYSFQLLGAVIVLIVGYIIGGWLSRLLLTVLEKRDVDVTLRLFIASAGRLIIVGMFLIIALSQMGISITPLIAAIGGLAIGASFAIQGPVSNYGAGLVIILTRMFKVTDTISVCGYAGVVREITLSTTILESEDGEQIVIPNKHIVGEIHRNSFGNRIIEGQLRISYDADPEQAIEVIRQAITGVSGIAAEPDPVIGINSFSESAFCIDYRVWVPSDRYFQLLHAVNLAIHRSLKTANMHLSLPKQEVRLLSD